MSHRLGVWPGCEIPPIDTHRTHTFIILLCPDAAASVGCSSHEDVDNLHGAEGTRQVSQGGLARIKHMIDH